MNPFILFLLLFVGQSMHAAAEPKAERYEREVQEFVASAELFFMTPRFVLDKHPALAHRNIYYFKLIKRLSETLSKPEALHEILHFLTLSKDLLTPPGKEWLLRIYTQLVSAENAVAVAQYHVLFRERYLQDIHGFLFTPRPAPHGSASAISEGGVSGSSLRPGDTADTVVAGSGAMPVLSALGGGVGARARMGLRLHVDTHCHFSPRDHDVNTSKRIDTSPNPASDNSVALKIIKGLVPFVQEAKASAPGSEKDYMAKNVMRFITDIIPAELYKKPVFLKMLRNFLITSLGHGLTEVSDVDGLYLYLLAFVRNVIQKRLIELEGALSPSRFSYHGVPSSVPREPLREILFLEDRLSQKDHPKDANSCTLFSIYHALCFIQQQEGISDEAGLAFTNKAKYDDLYANYWMRIILSYNRNMHDAWARRSIDDSVERIQRGEPIQILGGLPAEIVNHLCKEIIEGRGGIASPQLRKAFQQKVVHITSLHEHQRERNAFDTETVLESYKIWSREASKSPFADAGAIESFRRGTTGYLVVLHANSYDSNIGFAESHQSPHATAWCVERVKGEAPGSRVIIADSDASEPSRGYIKYVYNEIFANGALDA